MKGSNYPAQTGTYSVKVKNGAGWHAFDKARLQISVGQEYHEGEKLKATFEWARHRFSKVIICLNDTLQRHNYEAEGLTSVAAFAFAEAAGREWLERNIRLVRSLPDYELKRWEEWRSDPHYNFQLNKINELYKDDEGFRAQVDNEVSAFWKRKLKRDSTADQTGFAKFKKHSLNYLLEECAVFQLMFERDKAVDIYPGSTLLPCKLQAVKGLGKRGYTRIDFSRNEKPERKIEYG